MAVLVYLASRQGTVVTREELENSVWPNEVVGYGAVTNTIIKLRKALGDDTRKARYIVTVPKRGYQLVAEVRHDSLDGRPAARAPGEDAPPAGRPWFRAGVAAAIAVAGLLLAFGLARLWSPARDDAAELPNIVVLPFENLSDSPAQGYLADGITDDIITDLSRLSNVRVIAATTSSTYKGSQASPAQIAAELNVTYVLKGSVRRLGDEIRVNTQLIHAKSGVNAWAQRYDARVTELFAVQDEVTQRIINALAVRMTTEEKDRLAQRATNNLEAYDHFQEGQKQYHISSQESFARAREEYRRAIELDPSYGRAYGALAITTAGGFVRGWSESPHADLEQAVELARKAVALDPSTPQTHFALGWVYLAARKYQDALEQAVHSTRIAPSYADGYALQGLIRMYQGQPKLAIELATKGIQLDPYFTHLYLIALGGARYMLGEYDKAIPTLENASERNENHPMIKLLLAASYAAAGRLDDAAWEIDQLAVMSPTTTVTEVGRSVPIADPAIRQTLLNNLRKAGLPE